MSEISNSGTFINSNALNFNDSIDFDSLEINNDFSVDNTFSFDTQSEINLNDSLNSLNPKDFSDGSDGMRDITFPEAAKLNYITSRENVVFCENPTLQNGQEPTTWLGDTATRSLELINGNTPENQSPFFNDCTNKIEQPAGDG
jgi:hypothetical protein